REQSHLLSLERDCFGVLNGILNEIASVALLPRNDGDFRIPCDEILGSSRGMTQNTQGEQFL
ncbi:MAG: hypothetical protein MR469_09100, partial [Campylobacter sp.]|uniref:hypothetical protein n=1 Tax=Campylobacter sp. TaxID=205 RepID=UPI002AA8FD9F